MALFAKEGGLSIVKRLFKESALVVKSNGYLICEIGYNQAEEIRSIIKNEDYKDLWRLHEIVEDLQSIPRTVVLQRV
jgi:methylase of polypeptide subunit release factors